MKITAKRINPFLAAPPPEIRAVLLYGPDSGLVRERAGHLVANVVDDASDPFRIAEFAAAALRDDPAKLSDEAAAMSLTGGRRVVRVREATDTVAETVADFLDGVAGDTLVLIEAGELAARSKLRKLFEAHARAAALACYADEGGTLAAVIRDTLGAHGVTADGDAIAYLTDNLGADRMITRSELENLALYVDYGGTASLADALACVGDSAAMTIEDVAFAAGGGHPDDLARALQRAFQDGANPVAVLRMTGRHFQRLHQARSLITAGEAAEAAVRALRPPVFFKRAEAFRAQLRYWSGTNLASALDSLTRAEIDCKTTGLPAEAVCGQALMALSAAARRQQRA